MESLAVPRNQWLGEDIKAAIDARRIHHQLAPMEVAYEEGFPEVTHTTCFLLMCFLTSQDILDALRQRGHRTLQQDSFGSVVVAIGRLFLSPFLT